MDERTEKSFNKLKNFVLNDAHKQREKITEEIEEKINSELEQKKKEFMREADRQIQSGLETAKRENKTEVLETEMKAKKELMSFREDIVNGVFEEVKKKISEFKNTEEYKKWLLHKAHQAIDSCGEGKKTVYVSAEDMDKLEGIEAEKAERNILGGIIAENTEKGIVADYSLDELLSEARDNFLKSSGLTIEF